MKIGKKRVESKGDRLNWMPMKDLKPVKLSAMDVKGQVLTFNDLKASRVQISKVVLVP